VSYAGYPYTFNSLMPDNGLANLAGALLCTGNETLVLDYGTVENVRRMMPEDISRDASGVFRSMATKLRAGETLSDEDLRSVSLLETRVREAGEKRCAEVCEEICDLMERFRPHFIGFKLWNGDGFTGSVRIAETIRQRHKNVKLFGGGPHVDIFRQNLYRATDVFDCLVYGEGEETIIGLAEHATGRRDLRDVKNAVYRNDSGSVAITECERIADLNSLPLPRYDELTYPAMKGDNKLKVIVLDESRGCPFRCHFCIHPIKSGPNLRTKSGKRVVEEMSCIMEQVGTNAFRYAGSSTPTQLGKEIADLILQQGMKVVYAAFGNAANAAPDYFDRMRESGCRSIFFGIESGSEEILRRSMGKKMGPDRIAEVITRSRKAGMFTVGSVIFPSPFETEQSERATKEFLFKTRPDSVVVQFPIVYPETEWAVNGDKFGISFDKRKYVQAAMNYKAKPLMPLEFWDELPFSLNGKDFRTIRREAARFAKELEKNGILTSVSDDLVLIAELAGYGGREREFRDLTQAAFFCGDVEWIGRVVASVNEAAAEMKTEAESGRTMKSA
jgi:radical SAM superfamily enzyme YgiQ (UPF0313 family)